jgi:hypothetical protein
MRADGGPQGVRSLQDTALGTWLRDGAEGEGTAHCPPGMRSDLLQMRLPFQCNACSSSKHLILHPTKEKRVFACELHPKEDQRPQLSVGSAELGVLPCWFWGDLSRPGCDSIHK